MSLEFHVFLSASRLPTAEAWQGFLRSNALGMELYPALNPAEHSGFVPCSSQDENTGFEYYLDDAREIAATYPELSGDVEQYDSVATFRWGANLVEGAVAIMAASALTTLTDGLMFDPQGGTRVRGPDALNYARTALDQIARFQRK